MKRECGGLVADSVGYYYYIWNGSAAVVSLQTALLH